MDDLQTIKVGGLTKDSDTSSPTQITNYVKSALSAQTVALGGNDASHKDTKTKADKQSVVIGYNAEDTDPTGKDTSVVAIGSGASANNWGTAVGVGAKANLGLAFGADAWAEGSADHMAIALGRYAKATGQYAVQLGGDFGSGKYLAVNNEDKTFKFYNGSKNVTIVNADGKISADNAYVATKLGTTAVGSSTKPIYLNNGVATVITSYIGNVTGNCSGSSGSCTGNAATATKLQTARTIGGVSFDGTANISLPGVNTAGTQNTSGKASTAGTADNANALNNGAKITINNKSYNIGITQIKNTTGATLSVLTLS